MAAASSGFGDPQRGAKEVAILPVDYGVLTVQRGLFAAGGIVQNRNRVKISTNCLTIDAGMPIVKGSRRLQLAQCGRETTENERIALWQVSAATPCRRQLLGGGKSLSAGERTQGETDPLQPREFTRLNSIRLAGDSVR